MRHTVDGRELERVGVTYVLHNADSGWRIAVFSTHAPHEAPLTK